jgi:hypothetical protein
MRGGPLASTGDPATIRARMPRESFSVAGAAHGGTLEESVRPWNGPAAKRGRHV